VHTRAIIDAIHNGTLAKVRTQPDRVFGFNLVPECLGVPSESHVIRGPTKRPTISLQRKLLQLVQDNFKKYQGDVPATVAADVAA